MDLTTLERLPLWIGGRAVPARTQRYGEVTNPATGEVIRHVPLGNAADVDAAVRAAAAALPGLARVAAAAARAHPDALPRADGRAQEGAGGNRHARSTARRSPTPRARSRAASRSSSSRRAFRICSRASSARTSAPTSTAGRCASRVGVCAGITPFNFPAMVPMWMFPGRARLRQHVHPEAVRARSDAVAADGASCCTEAGLPDGVFNVVHGDKEAVDAHPRASGHPGRVVRRLDADRASTSTRRAPRHGKRVQALGGAKNHAVVLPDADSPSPPMRSSARATARRASAAWRFRRSSRSAMPAIRWSRELAVARAARQGRARAARAGHRNGAGGHVRGARPDRRLHRRRRRRGRDARRRRAQARACPATKTASSSGRRCSTT